MSQVEVLTAHGPVQFENELISCSPLSTSSHSSSDQNLTNALINRLLSAPQHFLRAADAVSAAAGHDEIIIPGLPPLHHGHPDIHLRNGVIRATQLSVDGEPDAEKAFFVADLSYTLQQHLKWKKFLPEIHPFYGKSLYHTS